MTDMRSENYFEIGKTILQKYFDYYIENSLDDTEYLPVVRLTIEGITEQMRSSGMSAPSCDDVGKKLKTSAEPCIKIAGLNRSRKITTLLKNP